MEQAFASVSVPLRVPCWNILSIGHVGGIKSFDVHCRVLLRKGVNSYCTVPLRSFLSNPLVTCTLSCRCCPVGSGLGVRFGFRFGFGLVNMIGNSSCVFCLVIHRMQRTRLVAAWFHKPVDSYGLEGYD